MGMYPAIVNAARVDAKLAFDGMTKDGNATGVAESKEIIFGSDGQSGVDKQLADSDTPKETLALLQDLFTRGSKAAQALSRHYIKTFCNVAKTQDASFAAELESLKGLGN